MLIGSVSGVLPLFNLAIGIYYSPCLLGYTIMLAKWKLCCICHTPHQHTSMAQGLFLRWVQSQGRSPDASGSSKNASGPVGISPFGAPQAPVVLSSIKVSQTLLTFTKNIVIMALWISRIFLFRNINKIDKTCKYIYIYKYIYFIKHNRHFMSTYFLLDPFEFPYYFYCILG